MLVVIVSGLPIIAVVFFYGGVSPLEMSRGYFTILLISLFFASLGFLASCLFTRVASAVAWAYGFMLLYCIGLPVIYLLLLFFAAPGIGEIATNEYLMLLPLGPLFHLSAYLDATMSGAFWAGAAGSGVEMCLFLAGCTVLIRRLRGASPVQLGPAARKTEAAGTAVPDAKTGA
jgi:hypothetical protein